MARTSLFKKKPKLDIEVEGCRSCCDICPVINLCGGCTGICRFDSHKRRCSKCQSCPARCWRRNDIAEWEFEIDGFQFDDVKCKLTYKEEIPLYLPQIRDNVNDVEHPAYIINIAKLINLKTMRLLHRPIDGLKSSTGVCQHTSGLKSSLTRVVQSNLRTKWMIPKGTKLILSFCCKDNLIDYIWAHQCDEWSTGKDFWQTMADYGFDAALSIDYSCFLDYPRLDHLTNMKRNVISAQRLARVGVPMILDVMTYNMKDLDRLVMWGKDNDFKWFHLNFQKTFKVDWMKNVITERCDRIFELVSHANIIISGIGDADRITFFVKRYGGRVCLSSANVAVHSGCGRLYDANIQKWIASKVMRTKDLFRANLTTFTGIARANKDAAL